MPIHINWAEIDPPILHYTMVEPWDWDEFQQAVTESRLMIESCEFTRVDMVIDWSNARMMPNNMLSQMGNLFRRGEGRSKHIQGRFVVVGASRLGQVLFDALLKVYPKVSERIFFTSSLEEAFLLLRQQAAEPTPEN